MHYSNTNQILLIISGIIVTALFGVFLYREMFPEYKIYQDDYIALEEFRSSYTHQPSPPFKTGVKQLVLEREDKGPAVIDRCTSCHLALQIPYFSPTKIAYDINGHILKNQEGQPILVPNEEYIWGKLDQKIAELRDEKVNEQLQSQGQYNQIKERLKQANAYESLKTAQVGDQHFDVTKVLSMHPLIGKETRPFEYHPIEEYGCTSCHNGNGRGLTTEKAHGPVFDGQYEPEFTGMMPKFNEEDPKNDPPFARIFNHKPDSELLFQTEPIFVGPLIQAKCMQCHQTSQMQFDRAIHTSAELIKKREDESKSLKESIKQDKDTLVSLLDINQRLMRDGYNQTLNYLKRIENDYSLPPNIRKNAESQVNSLEKESTGKETEDQSKKNMINKIYQQMEFFLGSYNLAQALQEQYNQEGEKVINTFLASHRSDVQAKGILFSKENALNYNEELMRHIQETQTSFQMAIDDNKTISAIATDVDNLTRNYQRGKELYLSQACYACHRISGFARGGVGPELTRIGNSYPWYIKESIVWPQADLKTSTMPNMRLDHREIEDLMAFLLAQKGGNRAIAQTAYQADLLAWEAGKKMPWEKPVPPAQIYDLRYAMTIFAVEGCASCHRLQGFESNVGFKIEKEPHSFEDFYEQQEWFKKLFPEVIRLAQYDQNLPGSQIVERIEKHIKDIDERIVSDVRQNSLLEEINQNHPEEIEALYSEFRYASRAKDDYYNHLILQEKSPEKIIKIKSEYQAWKDRVYRVLMMYIQIYGLGRLIGPHPNWSGVYRTDEWLMEHFRNPTIHVPRSIMPVFPFDDTKFYALTHMLDVLAIRNRQATRAIWENRGFDPAEAYQIHCAQCHGLNLQGNGPISEWIYPIPKSLRNSDFLRNLSKERAIYSITHGVRGTPMPPWGELAKDKPLEIQEQLGNKQVLTDNEIRYLVDWLFSSLPGGEVIRSSKDILKWHYGPQDVLDEIQEEGGQLHPLPTREIKEMKKEQVLPEKNLPEENNPPIEPQLSDLFPTGEDYYVAIRPEIYPKQAPQGVQQVNKVEDVFHIIPNPTEPDGYNYYIKDNYYTPYNLQEGQKFFLLNCAPCHGNEGDGSGIRSQAMQEAKPRMLNNLDWINSRDDLRLLRSIKYGVPGTSMTPWGDQTNSLQRMQLVMFIRRLSKEQSQRSALDAKLYQIFDKASFLIDQARVELSLTLEKSLKEEQQAQQELNHLENLVERGVTSPQEALKAYQRTLQLSQKIKQLQDHNQKMIELKKEVKQERDIYQNLGNALIAKDVGQTVIDNYLKLIGLNENRYSIQYGRLMMQDTRLLTSQIKSLRELILDELTNKLAELESNLKIMADSKDTQKKQDLQSIEANLNSLNKIRIQMISDSEEALRSANKQKEIMDELQAELSSKDQESKNLIHPPFNQDRLRNQDDKEIERNNGYIR